MASEKKVAESSVSGCFFQIKSLEGREQNSRTLCSIVFVGSGFKKFVVQVI